MKKITTIAGPALSFRKVRLPEVEPEGGCGGRRDRREAWENDTG
jgi:hypothetical protein